MTIFARNLFRWVFNPEDIIGHSLTGRRSTSLHEFCLKTHGFEIGSVSSKKFLQKRKSAKTSIIKSLSDYVREENSSSFICTHYLLISLLTSK
ncbi:unnamed protein product [Allacma fusca]|uniref:Uncharacterized protein n=1 Tax=Allacma fusca TaxID=39272 RepID=A0A8J2JVD3_9HEXA|nr:unnamed protein product [Allacma fusca]